LHACAAALLHSARGRRPTAAEPNRKSPAGAVDFKTWPIPSISAAGEHSYRFLSSSSFDSRPPPCFSSPGAPALLATRAAGGDALLCCLFGPKEEEKEFFLQEAPCKILESLDLFMCLASFLKTP
jgi:hypothetical protein